MVTEIATTRYEEVKAFYNEINSKTNLSDLERVYLHEARSPINTMENFGVFSMYPNEKIQNIINSTNASMEKLKDLEELVSMRNCTKKDLFSEKEIDIREIVEREREIYGDYNFKIRGSSRSNIKKPVITSLISTNIGNAIKWSPKESLIEIEIEDYGNATRVLIENEYGALPQREDIGQGKGIGLKFSKEIVDLLGGEYCFYGSPLISKRNVSKVWGVTIVLPNKP